MQPTNIIAAVLSHCVASLHDSCHRRRGRSDPERGPLSAGAPSMGRADASQWSGTTSCEPSGCTSVDTANREQRPQRSFSIGLGTSWSASSMLPDSWSTCGRDPRDHPQSLPATDLATLQDEQLVLPLARKPEEGVRVQSSHCHG
ncbi:uncharacterized protein LOC126249611 [Schistocerca nitens]|uniref:uncharacterized protein LOC126249611 n=1 Tax=Schistocerca nitens TaxID=7011 RepID=UPI002118BE24|nr:uncharacterized protein LOC126249611 [Schistocerca nitens]